MALFTAEELEELRRADAELDDEFVQSQDDILESRARDREAILARMDNTQRKIAEQRAAYYAANKDKIAEYRSANRDRHNAYMREYMRKYRQRKKAATN